MATPDQSPVSVNITHYPVSIRKADSIIQNFANFAAKYDYFFQSMEMDDGFKSNFYTQVRKEILINSTQMLSNSWRGGKHFLAYVTRPELH